MDDLEEEWRGNSWKELGVEFKNQYILNIDEVESPDDTNGDEVSSVANLGATGLWAIEDPKEGTEHFDEAEKDAMGEVQEKIEELMTKNVEDFSEDGRRKSNGSEDEANERNIFANETVLYVIFDTNIWLHRLNEIKKVLNDPSQNQKVYVPRKIVDELDRLKGNRRNKKLFYQARKASKLLETQREKFIFQNMEMYVESLIVPPSNFDDVILLACKQLAKQGKYVLLCSADGLFLVKARTENIDTMAAKDIQKLSNH